MNSQGGLHCHPLKYIGLDDGGDPSRNQALTAQLVDQDKAIAIVYNAAPLAGQASIPYMTQKQVPAIGSEMASNWYYTNPVYFPQATSGDDSVVGTFAAFALLGRPQGKNVVGIVSCVEASICSTVYQQGPSIASRVGLTLGYRAQASLAQPDFTANCQAAKSAGVQMFYLGLDTNSIDRFARSCASINFHPTFGLFSLVTLPSLASNSLLNGAISTSNTAPYTDTASATVSEYLQALKRYAPGSQPQAAGIAGWVAAKLFQEAANNMSEPPTSQSILNGLWSMKGDDLGGLTQPLTFAKGQNHALPLCYWATVIQGGQFVSPNNFQRVCA
jgi:branched-chain amino acid transport system substrate-binding protein